MKHSILLMVTLLALSACSKEEAGTEGMNDNGTYTLKFTTEKGANTRAEGGTGNLIGNSPIQMTVLDVDQADNNGVLFLSSPYLVTVENGLAYATGSGMTDKQKIIEVKTGKYSFYGAGVNDGDVNSTLVLTPTTDERQSTFATENGVEYVFASVENHSITNEVGSRTVDLTFKRQVAKVVFSVVAGSGVVALPPVATADQVATFPTMNLPKRSNNTEGLLNLTTGITQPLTTLSTDQEKIDTDGVGAPIGFGYCILPLEIPNPTNYNVQFKLSVAITQTEDGDPSALAERTFDVVNIPLPTIGNGNACGFEKGKLYKYTITVSNTGAYFSQVNVEDWETVDGGGLDAQ